MRTRDVYDIFVAGNAMNPFEITTIPLKNFTEWLAPLLNIKSDVNEVILYLVFAGVLAALLIFIILKTQKTTSVFSVPLMISALLIGSIIRMTFYCL